jgi:hypothetical protein
MDEALTAYTKLACARAAQAVARWAGEVLLPLAMAADGSDATHSAAVEVLRSAIAEAPELTVSRGPQDLQLDLISNEFPIGGALR